MDVPKAMLGLSLKAMLGLSSFAVSAFVVAIGPAAAATVNIGAVGEIGVGALPEPITVGGYAVQVAEASGTYAVPAGYGVITSWSHSAGTSSGVLSFKIYRPTGVPKEFRLIGADTRTVTANTVQVFPVQIPVLAGDRIGVSSEDVQEAYETFDPADRIGFFGPDPPPSATETTYGEPFQNFKLDVAATVESDVNGDGRGDDSQVSAGAPLVAVSRQIISPRAFPAAASGSSATTASSRTQKRRRYGAQVSYILNSSATVRFTVQQILSGRRKGTGKKALCVPLSKRNRKVARCKRIVTLKSSFVQVGKTGANTFHFTGRLGGKRLKPGSYALVTTPIANARTGQPVRTGFRIIK